MEDSFTGLGADSGRFEWFWRAQRAARLAQAGMDIVGVHLDFKKTLRWRQSVQADLEAAGRKALSSSMHAAGRREAGQALLGRLQREGCVSVRVRVHSLAFRLAAAMVAATPDESLTRSRIECRSTSWGSWCIGSRVLVWQGVFADDARVSR